ncbi:molybdenum cofactor sulfurase isoform X2 [Panulirus ornatus]|uniref:molybdenum cofactor sulfurase isoform X2 n=1 Tax=Panulirus ornatus TaxID=150431 RepID=UPI003A839157
MDTEHCVPCRKSPYMMAAELDKLKVAPAYSVERLLQEEFQRCEGHSYLDHAGATLYSDSQIKEVSAELQSSLLGNPHSRHLPSDTATQIIESVRHRVLEHFNTTLEEYDVIFTSGATHALKIVAECFHWNSSCKLFHKDNDILSEDSAEDWAGHIVKNDVQSRNESTSYNDNHEAEVNHGAFVYVRENHTSVLGMRGPAYQAKADVYCLQIKELYEILEHDPDTPWAFHNICSHVSDDEGSEAGVQGNDHTTDRKMFTVKEEKCIKLRRNCLFAYSGQCNFSGTKAPMEWITKVQKGALNKILKPPPVNGKGNQLNDVTFNQDDPHWFVLLDAAGLTATCPLDLSKWKPDFIPVSFYKIFGYPSGLGCLLVRNTAWQAMEKSYYGGGTLLMIDSRKILQVPRPRLHDRFEDGTLPFLSILAVRHGLDAIRKLTGGMDNISHHVFHLARYTHHCLQSYRHANGSPVAKLYCEEKQWDIRTHGSIVNFNLLNSDGSYIGYAQAGHICGDAQDLVDGLPTGSVRVSFGYMSCYDDADLLLKMVRECFVDGPLFVDLSWIKKTSVVPTAASGDRCDADFEVHKGCAVTGTSKFALEKEPDENAGGQFPSIYEEPDVSKAVRLQLTDIIIYPVKSCSGLSVQKWSMVQEGLKFDRRWMVVTSSGVTLTQKQLPLMCCIKPYIDFEAGMLTLKYEGEIDVSVPLEPPASRTNELSMCGGRVCGDRVRGLDCGPEVGMWLSQVLGQSDLKLMLQINKRMRKLESVTHGDIRGSLSLANESQYLVIHRPSVRKLLNEIQRNRASKLTEDELVRRFRGNLIIDGGSPYEEDSWTSLTIDKHQFQIEGGCRRCQMVSVVPGTGERTQEPMLTLAATRGSSMKFGVHATAVVHIASPEIQGMSISVGAPVLSTNSIDIGELQL